jgi:bacterial/archaeal transporter family protein
LRQRAEFQATGRIEATCRISVNGKTDNGQLFNFLIMWVLLGIISSFILGIYDLFKKSALENNPVMPVLFLASLTSALIFLPLILISSGAAPDQTGALWYVPPVSSREHLLIFLKSVLVGTSWVLSYFALRNLPITIVTPIRASSPLWTLVGALVIFGERLSPLQWAGITVTIVSYYLFSLAGKKEGITFQKNKWVFFIFLATIIGAASGLYDKFLISNIERMAVQAWFSIYLIPVLLPLTLFIWFRNRNKNIRFFWTPAIPLIGLTLTLSDYSYFYALSFEDSLISILAVLRRSSVLISFTAGAFLFREINLTRKSVVLAGILIGVFLIILGS